MYVRICDYCNEKEWVREAKPFHKIPIKRTPNGDKVQVEICNLCFLDVMEYAETQKKPVTEKEDSDTASDSGNTNDTPKQSEENPLSNYTDCKGQSGREWYDNLRDSFISASNKYAKGWEKDDIKKMDSAIEEMMAISALDTTTAFCVEQSGRWKPEAYETLKQGFYAGQANAGVRLDECHKNWKEWSGYMLKEED